MCSSKQDRSSRDRSSCPLRSALRRTVRRWLWRYGVRSSSKWTVYDTVTEVMLIAAGVVLLAFMLYTVWR